MCSVFGFISQVGRRPNLRTLQRLVKMNEPRGPHAFGLAWVDRQGRLKAYKQTGKFTEHLALLEMARDAVALIGHMRWATHGSPSDQTNNHPHPCDGGWLVHNGVVGNYLELIARHELLPVSDCDSEVLAMLAADAQGKTFADRMAYAAGESEGSCVTLGLWSRPATLVAVRRGNPLHQCETAEGTYLATSFGSHDDSVPVRDCTATQFTFDEELCDADVYTRPVKRDRHLSRYKIGSSLFESGRRGSGEYRGG